MSDDEIREALGAIIRKFAEDVAPILWRFDDAMTEHGQRMADEAEAWLAERTKR